MEKIPSEELKNIQSGIDNAKVVYEDFNDIKEKVVLKGIPLNKDNIKVLKHSILIQRLKG